MSDPAVPAARPRFPNPQLDGPTVRHELGERARAADTIASPVVREVIREAKALQAEQAVWEGPRPSTFLQRPDCPHCLEGAPEARRCLQCRRRSCGACQAPGAPCGRCRGATVGSAEPALPERRNPKLLNY